MYDIQILKGAIRDLERLDRHTGRRITQRIHWLSTNLDKLQPISLKGRLAGLCKLRDGDYRVIYQILPNEKTLLIHAIGHRREIYR